MCYLMQKVYALKNILNIFKYFIQVYFIFIFIHFIFKDNIFITGDFFIFGVSTQVKNT